MENCSDLKHLSVQLVQNYTVGKFMEPQMNHAWISDHAGFHRTLSG